MTTVPTPPASLELTDVTRFGPSLWFGVQELRRRALELDGFFSRTDAATARRAARELEDLAAVLRLRRPGDGE